MKNLANNRIIKLVLVVGLPVLALLVIWLMPFKPGFAFSHYTVVFISGDDMSSKLNENNLEPITIEGVEGGNRYFFEDLADDDSQKLKTLATEAERAAVDIEDVYRVSGFNIKERLIYATMAIIAVFLLLQIITIKGQGLRQWQVLGLVVVEILGMIWLSLLVLGVFASMQLANLLIEPEMILVGAFVLLTIIVVHYLRLIKFRDLLATRKITRITEKIEAQLNKERRLQLVLFVALLVLPLFLVLGKNYNLLLVCYLLYLAAELFLYPTVEQVLLELVQKALVKVKLVTEILDRKW